MKIRQICGVVLLLVAFTASAQGFGPAVSINGVDISRAKVEAQVDHLINLRGLGSGGITQPGAYRKLQEEIVEQLVVQELLWQEAQRHNITVSDAEVDEELNKLKNGFETEREFKFSIEAGGFTEETFKENIRQQRSVQSMIANEITKSSVADDAEIKAFYDDNLDKMSVPEQLRARHILIKVEGDDDAAKAAAMAKISAIQERLESGESFPLVAIDTSEGPSGAKGGDLGLFGRGQMVGPFEEAAFALQPGEVSEPVETQFGYHLIKLEERVAAEQVPFETASPQIRNYLSEQKLQQTVESLIANLRETGDVQIHLW